MSVPIIVLEGCDGVGKTTQSRLLQRALADLGYCALRWQHPTPPEGTSGAWAKALHYAAMRAWLYERLADVESRMVIIAGDHWAGPTPGIGGVLNIDYLDKEEFVGPRVLIADRWFWSTDAVGRMLVDGGLQMFAAAERRQIGDPDVTVLLTAPDGVIVDRLSARGEAVDRERVVRTLAVYRSIEDSYGMWPTINTEFPVDDVTSLLVKAVLPHLPPLERP